jgi:uroporphyrinogen-III synthase
MSGSFQNRVVAHFESRRRSELEGLIRRQQGIPWSAPALSEVPIQINAAEQGVLDRFRSGNFDVVVLLTGTGTRRLLDEAGRGGRLGEARAALAAAVTVARGPKPFHELKQHAIRPTHVAAEPNTTKELLDTLSRISVRGQRVLIVSAGEQLAEPITSLRERGAFPVELQLYRWDLTPDDAAQLERTIDALIAREIAVALFTTQVQVRHLFEVAKRMHALDDLTSALRQVLVGAVGPTTAAALRDRGVEPDVIPEHGKMGHLVVALARETERRAKRAPATHEFSTNVIDYVGAVLRGDGVPL